MYLYVPFRVKVSLYPSMSAGGLELAKTPELWKPEPFQLDVDVTTKLIGALPGGLAAWPSPGPPAGVSAGGFRCTVPSGATLGMSLLVLVELNVIVCTPSRYHVTEPPTGMCTVFGPNSSTSASCTLGEPEPESTGFAPGITTPGSGAFPLRSAKTAGCSFISVEASWRAPTAACALGLGTAVPDDTTTIFPVMPPRCSRQKKG